METLAEESQECLCVYHQTPKFIYMEEGKRLNPINPGWLYKTGTLFQIFEQPTDDNDTENVLPESWFAVPIHREIMKKI